MGDDGVFGVTPGDGAPVNATNAYVVANQAKLKMGTIFLELCGVAIPPGYDGCGVGKVPGSDVSTQFGMEEFRSYCSTVDRGAKDIGNKAVLEHLIDNNEKLLRVSTSPANHLTMAAALVLRTPTLDQAIDAHVVAKAHYGAPAAGVPAGRVPKGKDPKEDDPKGGDGLGGLGPGGAFSRKQIEAMRRQSSHPYSGGKGGGGGGGGGGKGAGKGGGKGGGWGGGGYGAWQGGYGGYGGGNNQGGGGGWGGGGNGGAWQGNGAWQGGGNPQGGGGPPPGGAPPGAPAGGRVACRDFQAGNCTRGAACRFAH